MTFPLMHSAERTDASFRAMDDRRHHRRATPLTELNVDMVKGLHLACQGTIRKWTFLLREGDNVDQHHRLSDDDLQTAEERLALANRGISSDFNRDLKSFADCKRWKATQFRTWGLYYAPLVLKGLISEEKFYHYIHFFVGMRILLCKTSSEEQVKFANDCLRTYVSEFGRIYGAHHLHFNIHNLGHIAKDFENFEQPLDAYSCFPPETYLGKMIRLIRGTKRPLAQIFKRHSEREGHPRVIRELHLERLALVKKVGIDALKPGSRRDGVCMLPSRDEPFIIQVSEITDEYVFRFKFYVVRDEVTGAPLEFFDLPQIDPDLPEGADPPPGAPAPATDFGIYICSPLNQDRERPWPRQFFDIYLVEKVLAAEFTEWDDIENGEVERVLIMPFINHHV